MKRHKALLIEENLTFDELPERIKKKIQKYNSIENSNTFYYRDKKGKPTKRASEELTDLDDDICELVDVFIAEREETINSEADREAQRIEQERLAELQESQSLEQERLAEIEKQKTIQPKPTQEKGFWETLFG